MTYRQQIDRLMRAQPWLMVGMDLGLGPFADHPLNEWQESFLPMVLAREIRSVGVPDGRGGVKPLVVSERQIAPNHLAPPGKMPPDLDVPLGTAGLALAITMLASRPRLPELYASLASGVSHSRGNRRLRTTRALDTHGASCSVGECEPAGVQPIRLRLARCRMADSKRNVWPPPRADAHRASARRRVSRLDVAFPWWYLTAKPAVAPVRDPGMAGYRGRADVALKQRPVHRQPATTPSRPPTAPTDRQRRARRPDAR